MVIVYPTALEAGTRGNESISLQAAHKLIHSLCPPPDRFRGVDARPGTPARRLHSSHGDEQHRLQSDEPPFCTCYYCKLSYIIVLPSTNIRAVRSMSITPGTPPLEDATRPRAVDTASEESGQPHAAGPDYRLITHEDDIQRASRSLKAMSHPLRLKILCILGNNELSVQDIVERVGTSQSNISQHLAILRDMGILTSRKDANRVYYRVQDPRNLRLIAMMREVFCNC
jgi:DNA-binding transcriptional ArsR family regulator